MEPYIGQIHAFAFTFVPKGWLRCDGTLLNIADYQALYSLIGTKYGGNGVTTFALPDLRGRVPVAADISAGSSGVTGGAREVTLTVGTLPSHSHKMLATTSDATSALATNAIPATVADGGSGTIPVYGSASGGNTQVLNSRMVGAIGGGGAHNNMQPYTVVGFCIATTGIYPQKE